ncbi:MAG TPA: chorismate lyase [Gammaproteobacteria bacterium]|nr:chorismate lyase [Gammaproteobacteria bacterium]
MIKPKFRHDSAWRRHRCLFNKTLVPAALWPWLLDPESLTRRLQQVCDGHFRVQLLRQGWAQPLRDESRALHLRSGRHALVREVYLLCYGRPWVFARTVIPRATLAGKYRHLTRLGNKSLGAVLFSDPAMQRSEVEIAAITPGQTLFEAATRGLPSKPRGIWGRRSLFYLGRKPLLLNEVFLHDMSATGHQQP